MIYFVTARELGRVKIGHAKDPTRRLGALQTGSPVPLELECVCPGGESVEARLHARFSEHRVAGEWFELAPEIEAHMASLPKVKKRAERTDPMTRIRKALGLSQSEMAARLGLHQTTISRFERGELPTDRRTLLAAQLLLAQQGGAA